MNAKAMPVAQERCRSLHDSMRVLSVREVEVLRSQLSEALAALDRPGFRGLGRSLAAIVTVGFRESPDASRMALRALLAAARTRNAELREYVTSLRKARSTQAVQTSHVGTGRGP